MMPTEQKCMAILKDKLDSPVLAQKGFRRFLLDSWIMWSI